MGHYLLLLASLATLVDLLSSDSPSQTIHLVAPLVGRTNRRKPTPFAFGRNFPRCYTVDKSTGNSESITIKHEKGRLSDEEIERMLTEAEEFAVEDKAQRKRIEAMNTLSNFFYSIKRLNVNGR